MTALGLRRCFGYTAIELMVVVFIAGILATMAFPSFVESVRNGRLDTHGELLRADLLIARREAIKLNGRVLVCPAGTSAGSCGTDYTKWARGWVVCYDLDADGNCDAASAAVPNPIVQRGGLDPSLMLTGPSAAVRFNSNGTQGAGSGVIFTLRGTWTGSRSAVDAVAASGNITMAKGS